ncbi:ead/Ea22-like family protein [Salmonella enterica]|nr:ead/Ea22-like family protein [Salmonella enterica]
MNIEKAKRQLRVMLSGPASGYMECATAVKAILDELEATEKRIAEQREYYEGVIADGSKRIAELESNEVREVGNQFLVVRHPGKTPAIKHCTGDLEEFLRKLIEQDPLVTIDIITHRYYGVGGQWVQDTGEYLQMMQGAGIGVKGE